MSELLNDEVLSTADLVNPPRSAAGLTEPEIAEADASLRADSFVVVDSAGDMRTVRPVVVARQPAQANQLFPQDELERFHSRWDKVQTSFVDEPRTAVERADSLVANVFKRIAEQFISDREQLEKQWDRGESVSTEELRQTLQRYRSFFDRLLAFRSSERSARTLGAGGMVRDAFDGVALPR